jgi:tRNA (guanine10-N2)-dimethyltransferase
VYVLELGGEDDRFAAAEAGNAATDVTVVAPGLATASAVDSERLRGLAYTHRASELVGRADASVESARALLDAAPLDRDGPVAVRARDVRGTSGVDTQVVERALGGVLVERGYAVDLDDPNHELRAVFSDETCALGWLAVESRRDYGDRQPTAKPFFQPGSMDPLDARALANLAGAGPGATVLDPMCGTGGVLLEAGLLGAGVVGVDAQWKMVRGARENLGHFLPEGAGFETIRGDATRLPLRDDAVDAAVFDAPYGRQSKIAGRSLDDLVGGALSEVRRVASRAVVVGDRGWTDAAEAAGWTVVDSFERPVHRSLTRYVVVLEGATD